MSLATCRRASFVCFSLMSGALGCSDGPTSGDNADGESGSIQHGSAGAGSGGGAGLPAAGGSGQDKVPSGGAAGTGGQAACVGAAEAADVRIDAVFFAQTHVQEPTEPDFADGVPGFRLVAERNALLKVNLTSTSGAASPPVTARVRVAEQVQEFCLLGPSAVPRDVDPATHSFTNSFSVVLPADLVKPGMEIELLAGDAEQVLKPTVGAPNRLKMRVFRMGMFGSAAPATIAAEVLAEMNAKLPLAEPFAVVDGGTMALPSFVIHALEGVAAQAVTSAPEFAHHSNALSSHYLRTLARAAGEWNTAIYVALVNPSAGGWGGGRNFAGVGTPGVFWHELGHSLSLLHSVDNSGYPYVGDNVTQPNFHAGPTWAYISSTNSLVPATVQSNAVSTAVPVGQYKRDPMQGGGSGDQEQGYFVRHFSDYNTRKMQRWVELNMAQWDEAAQSYVRWNDAQGGLAPVTDAAILYPTETDVEVYTFWGAYSSSAAARVVYPPHRQNSNLIGIFDPTTTTGRAAAIAQGFCPLYGCDLVLRVVADGVTHHYLVVQGRDYATTVSVTAGGELMSWAVNVPASIGNVTRVELLVAENAHLAGVPAGAPVVASWQP